MATGRLRLSNLPNGLKKRNPISMPTSPRAEHRLPQMGRAGNPPAVTAETVPEPLDRARLDRPYPRDREDPRRHSGRLTRVGGHRELQRSADCARRRRYRARCDQDDVALKMESAEKRRERIATPVRRFQSLPTEYRRYGRQFTECSANSRQPPLVFSSACGWCLPLVRERS